MKLQHRVLEPFRLENPPRSLSSVVPIQEFLGHLRDGDPTLPGSSCQGFFLDGIHIKSWIMFSVTAGLGRLAVAEFLTASTAPGFVLPKFPSQAQPLLLDFVAFSKSLTS